MHNNRRYLDFKYFFPKISQPFEKRVNIHLYSTSTSQII